MVLKNNQTYSEMLKEGIPENIEENYHKCKHFKSRAEYCDIFKETCICQCKDNKYLKKRKKSE